MCHKEKKAVARTKLPLKTQSKLNEEAVRCYEPHGRN